jgi:YesN/AraC family two-component response regulator
MSANEHSGIKILFVEDCSDATEQILSFFSRRNEIMFAARNGQEGLDLFMSQRPEIVITDIRMPVMDGLQMVKEIKAVSPDTKIIVTTAHSDFEYMLQAIELGVDHYVVKPVDLGKLVAAIEKCSAVIDLKRADERHREEREKMITELQDALAKIRRLSGMLPICSSCKKIRDDKGYWKMIEDYISEHSEAEFTHGICPECMKKLYPWMIDKYPPGYFDERKSED